MPNDKFGQPADSMLTRVPKGGAGRLGGPTFRGKLREMGPPAEIPRMPGQEAAERDQPRNPFRDDRGVGQNEK